MNVYQYQFPVVCPNDGEKIVFDLTIETERTIFVEHIKEFLEPRKVAFQEELAEELYSEFAGRQRIKASHQGILITTIRGENE